MTEPIRPSEEDLQAFIDGELDAEPAARVETAIKNDAELARQIHAYRADKTRLAQIYGPLIERPLPEAWLTTIANRNVITLPARPTRRRFISMGLAASVAALAGGTIIVRQLSMRSGEALLAAALSAHAQAQAVPAGAVTEGALASIVGVPVKAPDLSKMGFALVGMRTLDGPGGVPAAVLAYRDAGERVFTLYLRPSPGTPAFEMIKRGETRICLWQDDVLTSVMLADVSAAEMLRLASLAYSELPA